MLTRRAFHKTLAAISALGGEAAFAQALRTMPKTPPPGAIWLNANENPEGPPTAAIEAMKAALPESGRYRFQEFPGFHELVAKSEGLSADQVFVGAGSSEVLHAAIDAFTSASRPLVAMDPTFELPGYLAESSGRKVIKTPLSTGYYADVKKLAEDAARSQAGLVYVCNPNNPTSALTPKADIDWLAENLPSATVLLLDEAYIHFADSGNALEHVRKARNVIVARTFSKIWGMAGLRVGFGCARPDLIEKLTPFRSGIISMVSQRAVTAALRDSQSVLPARRERFLASRADLCAWLKRRGLRYIEPQANFVMFDIGRDAGEFGGRMMERKVMVGRPFPPLQTMLRVTLGTDAEMAQFKRAFEDAWKS